MNDETLVNPQHHIGLGDGDGGHHHGCCLILNSDNLPTCYEGQPISVHQVIWQCAVDCIHSTTTNQDYCHHHHMVSHLLPHIVLLLNVTLCLALSTLMAVSYHASISSSWKKEEEKPPASTHHDQTASSMSKSSPKSSAGLFHHPMSQCIRTKSDRSCSSTSYSHNHNIWKSTQHIACSPNDSMILHMVSHLCTPPAPCCCCCCFGCCFRDIGNERTSGGHSNSSGCNCNSDTQVKSRIPCFLLKYLVLKGGLPIR